MSKETQKLFEKAKKIKFKDYDGKFILNSNDDFVKDSDAVYDWLYYKIKDENLTNEELPKYLWATQSEPVLSLNLNDIIADQCEDNGYDDMYNCLNTDDEDLIKAQEYLDKWHEKQGDSAFIYYYDNSIVVLLDDLIQEIRKDIEEGK